MLKGMYKHTVCVLTGCLTVMVVCIVRWFISQNSAFYSVRRFCLNLVSFLLLVVFSNGAQQLKGQRLVAECPPAAASLTNLKQPTEVICNKSNLWHRRKYSKRSAVKSRKTNPICAIVGNLRKEVLLRVERADDHVSWSLPARQSDRAPSPLSTQ